MRTLLILGASGLTGYKLMQIAKRRFETLGTYNLRKPICDDSLLKLDFLKDDLEGFIASVKPDTVINATALHNVDYCENHPEEAFNVNTYATAKIAKTCNRIGARLIQISSDFVFDGKKGNYSESDETNPLNVYARSKLEGEQEVEKCNSYSIIRTSVVYGWTPVETQSLPSSSGKPVNFALWALLRMKKKDELKVVTDQISSPTLADILAAIVLRIAATNTNNLYHVSGSSPISRYEFTKKLALAMGFPPDSVSPVDSQSFTQVARRPMNSSLNCEKVQKDLKFRIPTIDESLAIMRSQIEVDSPELLGN